MSSFAVHYALLTHTTWLPKYYEGSAAMKGPTKAAVATDAVVAAAPK